jgi:hypothetical protein
MTEAKDPRDEAERLIASVLGGASVAAENLNGWATGSDECCVCPVCRAIAAARQPNPNIAERLASGAGDLAQGLAGMLRAFSGGFPGSSQSAPSSPSGSTSTATDEDPWHTATRAAAEAEATGSAPAGAAPGAASTGAAPRGASAGAAPGGASAGAAPGAAEPAAPPNPPKPMAKKATKPKAVPEPEPEPKPEPEPGEES